MISPLTQTGEFTDLWGACYGRLAARLLSVGAQPDRFRMRIYSAPQIEDRLIPVGGYVRSSLAVTPGAFILGIMAGAEGQQFVFQVTDVALNHRWFSEPVPNVFFAKPSLFLQPGGHLSQLPWLFEAEYPVPQGSGLFLFEFWNAFLDASVPNAAPQLAEIDLLVAEPRCNANG